MYVCVCVRPCVCVLCVCVCARVRVCAGALLAGEGTRHSHFRASVFETGRPILCLGALLSSLKVVFLGTNKACAPCSSMMQAEQSASLQQRDCALREFVIVACVAGCEEHCDHLAAAEEDEFGDLPQIVWGAVLLWHSWSEGFAHPTPKW